MVLPSGTSCPDRSPPDFSGWFFFWLVVFRSIRALFSMRWSTLTTPSRRRFGGCSTRCLLFVPEREKGGWGWWWLAGWCLSWRALVVGMYVLFFFVWFYLCPILLANAVSTCQIHGWPDAGGRLARAALNGGRRVCRAHGRCHEKHRARVGLVSGSICLLPVVWLDVGCVGGIAVEWERRVAKPTHHTHTHTHTPWTECGGRLCV